MGALQPAVLVCVGVFVGAGAMAWLTWTADWLARPSKSFQQRVGYQQALKDVATHIDNLKHEEAQ